MARAFLLLVDARPAGGRARLKMKFSATGREQFLDFVAAKAGVPREGLDFEFFDDDFECWVRVPHSDFADFPEKALKVRLLREQNVTPAPVSIPSPEGAIMETMESFEADDCDEPREFDDDEPHDVAPAEDAVDMPVPAESGNVIPGEWVEACAMANIQLAEENVVAHLELVYSKGQGTRVFNGHPDLQVRCSKCPEQLRQTGGGSKRGCSFFNVMKHSRNQHRPGSAAAYVRTLATVGDGALSGGTSGPKRTYGAISSDDGAQKSAAIVAKEKYEAAAAILGNFKSQGRRLHGTESVVCHYCPAFPTGLLQRALRLNLQNHVNCEEHKGALRSLAQTRVDHFFPSI